MFYLTSMFIFISAMIMAVISILKNIWLDQNTSTPKFVPLPHIEYDGISFSWMLLSQFYYIMIIVNSERTGKDWESNYSFFSYLTFYFVLSWSNSRFPLIFTLLPCGLTMTLHFILLCFN